MTYIEFLKICTEVGEEFGEAGETVYGFAYDERNECEKFSCKQDIEEAFQEWYAEKCAKYRD